MLVKDRMQGSSANNRLLKNSVFMSARMVLVLMISLYTTRVVLTVLGAEDFGVYNVVSGFVSMFAFLNTSLSGAVQRFFNFELGKNGEVGANNVYSAAIVLHIALAVLTCIATELIGLWYIHNKLVLPEGRIDTAESIFHFSVVSLFFTIVNTPYMAAVMAHEKMNFYAVIEILRSVCNLGMALILPYVISDKLLWYGGYHLGITFLFFVVYFIYSKSNFKEIYYNRNLSFPLLKDLLSFSGWNILGSLSYMLRDQGVNLVLNFYFGTIVNAARAIAVQVDSALQGFVSSIVIPSRPQVIQSYSQSNINRSWNLTYGVSKLTCLLFYSMSLPICLEIDYILRIWLGPSVPDHTSLFIILILLTNTFGTLVAPISTIVQATGRIQFFQIASGISNLMTVPLAFIFLRFDKVPEYAFIALFITMSTNLMVGLISAKKSADLSLSYYFKKVLFPIIATMILAFPLCCLPVCFINDGLIRFIIVFVTSPIIIVFVSYFVALNFGEKTLAKQLLFKFFGTK